MTAPDDIELLQRARAHVAAALELADQARDLLLGARLDQCLETIDAHLGAVTLAASVWGRVAF